MAVRFEAGELQGKLKSARKILLKGMYVDTILEITSLSKKDLKDHSIMI
ncbi:hypothetical protein LEP1GSC073_1871 [Leptospira noguchii str. Cascata]|nr:hypothetical protein LEP1GSC072_3808 [Leptospira noguchii str. Bonito]EMS88119.1 hypothetical protein LEP1GSC073_1871 [Leptospira noguchii str. Cascata]